MIKNPASSSAQTQGSAAENKEVSALVLQQSPVANPAPVGIEFRGRRFTSIISSASQVPTEAEIRNYIEEFSQYVMETYYQVIDPKEKRVNLTDAGLHACYAAQLVDLVIALFNKFFEPEIAQEILMQDGKPFTIHSIEYLLTVFLVLYQGSGDQQKSVSAQSKSAENFAVDMRKLGFPPERISYFAGLMWSNKTECLSGTVLHDVREIEKNGKSGKKFVMGNLNIVKGLQAYNNGHNPAFEEIKIILIYYAKLMRFMNSPVVCHQYSHAKNYYRAILAYTETCRIYYVVFRRVYADAENAQPLREPVYLDVLERYNPRVFIRTLSELKKVLGLFHEEKEQKENTVDQMMRLYETSGFYVRWIRPEKKGGKTDSIIPDEIQATEESSHLSSFFKGKKKLPAMFIFPGILCSGDPGSSFAGFLINPYTVKAFSLKTKADDKTGMREKKGEVIAPDKLLKARKAEDTMRRNIEGVGLGKYWHAGKRELKPTKVVLTYRIDVKDKKPSDVVGITIQTDKLSARSGLELWYRTGCKFNFGIYYSHLGLRPASLEEVLWWAGYKAQGKTYLSNEQRFKNKLKELSIEESVVFVSVRNGIFKCDPASEAYQSKKYRFSVIQHKTNVVNGIEKKEAIGYMWHGLPVIEIDGKRYFDAEKMLPKVVESYYAFEAIQTENYGQQAAAALKL